jgi:type II secretory pathway component PulM
VKLGARERKFVIIGLGIIAILALLYVLVFSSRPDSEGLNDTLELRKKTLLKQRETLFLEGVYESRLQLYNNRLQADMAKLLPGDNPNVAGAELLNTLTDFAERSGVEIEQKSVLREEKINNDLSKISARLVTRCNMDQLVRFLTEIENYDKFLTIEEFRIGMARNRRETGMRPNLTISGYINSNENKTEAGDQDTNL